MRMPKYVQHSAVDFRTSTSALFIAKRPAVTDAGHYQAMLAFYGTKMGNRVARKHLGWFMDDAATHAGLRKTIFTESDPAKVLRLLPEALQSHQAVAA